MTQPFSLVEYMRDMTEQVVRCMGINYDMLSSEIERSTASATFICWEQQRARVFSQRREIQPVIHKIFGNYLDEMASPRQPHTGDMQTMLDDIDRVESLPAIRTAEIIGKAKRRIAKTFQDDFDRMLLGAFR